MGSLAAQFNGDSSVVLGRSLDSLISELNCTQVDLIKVDVEGFEAAVFRGALSLLQTHHPVVIFEFIDWAEQRSGEKLGSAQELLMSLGYTLHRIDEKGPRLCRLEDIITSGGAMLVAVPEGVESTPITTKHSY